MSVRVTVRPCRRCRSKGMCFTIYMMIRRCCSAESVAHLISFPIFFRKTSRIVRRIPLVIVIVEWIYAVCHHYCRSYDTISHIALLATVIISHQVDFSKILNYTTGVRYQLICIVWYRYRYGTYDIFYYNRLLHFGITIQRTWYVRTIKSLDKNTEVDRWKTSSTTI